MDKIFLIGHRGVGKTTILKDFAIKSKNYVCLDLDQEIETRENINIHDLFNSGQQKKFRSLEIKVLKKIITENKDKPLVVALGAGFELENFLFPKSSMILWLRRTTDKLGRIFFDRPSIFSDIHLDPLDEWNKIYKKRELKYTKYSNAKLIIPEYFDNNFNPLYQYLNFKKPENGFVTYKLNENHMLANCKDLNLELRTDLISEKIILNIINKNYKNTNLVSIRNLNEKFLTKIFGFKKKLKNNLVKSSSSNKVRNKKQNFLIDWDIDLGLPPKEYLSLIDVFSSHSDTAVEDVLCFNLKLLAKYGHNVFDLDQSPHFKLCPKVKSQTEAVQLDILLEKTFTKDSYSFLPRSNEGLDLSYFRQLKSYQQKIGFYRFSDGSSSDQPLWWQWPSAKPSGFYGIYGENIKHSYTPSFHKTYFASKFLSPISVDSFTMLTKYHTYFYQQGLKVLAVTSPYKAEAYNSTFFKGTANMTASNKMLIDQKIDFKSTNTIILKDIDKIIDGYNTDYLGLKVFFNKHINPNLQTIVWGGGALLEQLKNLLPESIFYSAQTGEIRDPIKKELSSNIQLVWASGENGLNPTFTKGIQISKIIDLDYRENSKARLYSFKNKIDYVSGFDFFVEQAKAQQFIWDKYEF